MNAADHASRFDAWQGLLARNPDLSARFADRYALALAGLEPQASPEAVAAARQAAPSHADAAVAALAGLEIPSSSRDRVPDLDGDAGWGTAVAAWAAGFGSIGAAMAALPRLAGGRVPLHPSRRARVLRLGTGAAAVAVAWEADSVSARAANAARLADLFAPIGARSGVEVAISWPRALLREGDLVWTLAPDLGPTLEDRLREENLPAPQRQAVVAALAAMRRAMVEAGVIWQGFAPRNMFYRDGGLVLIDFEEVADAPSEPVRAAECLAWHRVFFADCLAPSEIEQVLEGDPAGLVGADPDAPVAADVFEAHVLGKPGLTLGERLDLIGQSAALEGRHTRPASTRDGGVLFGHELGHFWGDFVSPVVEARLFALLRGLERRSLAACLEVCEAAMEADIAAMVAAGFPEPVSAPATTALVDAFGEIGADAIAAAREGLGDWYERLRLDPAGLVEDVLFDARTGLVSAGPLVVGAPEHRGAHASALHAVVDAGLDFVHRGRGDEAPVLRYEPAEAALKRLAAPLPVEGTELTSLLAEVQASITDWSIGQAHPGFLAFPDAGNAVAALAGSVLTRFLNQNLIAVDRSAPAATFVELQVIEWLRELIGFAAGPVDRLRGVKDAAGLWTTGGHLSNHLAMLTALGHRFPQARTDGVAALGVKPTIVMSGPIAHYSHSDAAFHLGLGWGAVRKTAAGPGFTTDPGAVEQALADPPAGEAPFMVVGVAGNCRTTGLDDLARIGEICRRYGVWFHVDACHGGSLIFSPRLRERHLAGIETADSVSLDPHKGLFTPYPSSYVVFREPGMLTQFSRHTAAVASDGAWDLGLTTPFLGSRGFESLSTWMLLRHIGTERLGALVEARQALVRHLASRIGRSGWFTMLNDVDFYRVAFVFCPPRLRTAIAAGTPEARQRAARVISAHTARLNQRLYEAGRVCFDEHTLADLADRTGVGADQTLTVMAACPGNPLTSRAELDAAVDELLGEAQAAWPALAEALEAEEAAAPARIAGPAGWSDDL